MNNHPALPDERSLSASRLHARREHLLNEIDKQSRRAPLHRRPWAIRVAVTVGVAVVALTVLSVTNVFGPNGPSLVEKAQAALALPENVVLHFTITGSQANGDGTTATWGDETWQLSSSPEVWRRIESASDARAAETGHTLDGESQIYDPETDTIYQSPEGVAVPEGSEAFKAEVMNLLGSGRVKEDGHVTVDGHDCIRLASDEGSLIYIVDAKTGEPVEWQAMGEGVTVTMRITCEKLPCTEANLGLVDLTKQYPGASLDTDPQRYLDAVTRAFPNG